MNQQELNQHKQDLFNIGRIGIKAQEFLDSEVGKMLRAKSDREYMSAMQKLVTADPTNQSEIVRLQQEAEIAKGSVRWLVEMVNESEAAEEQLRSYEQIDQGM